MLTSFSFRQQNAHTHDLFVIQYIEPMADNKEAVGFDIASGAKSLSNGIKGCSGKQSCTDRPSDFGAGAKQKISGLFVVNAHLFAR